ncbi:amidohydrolase family protein [Vibrio jasicida]|uniref:amidohydrolase family protein n=1 Tax=Vibrio jasicida TaxID=766224 RepID=UPI004068ED16
MPTLVSEKPSVMTAALNAVERGMGQRVDGLLGIHLEGPWLNPTKKGAHDENNFYSPSITQLNAFPWLTNGINFITLAPEKVRSESIKWLKNKGCIVAAGHTNLNEQDLTGKRENIHGFTHLYNAMASVGNPDESFTLDGQKIQVKDGKLVNEAGNLAGAHITMAQSVKNLIDWGVSPQHAYQMASTNPAHAINLENELGYLKVGYRASATILDKNGEPSCVLVDGNLYYL